MQKVAFFLLISIALSTFHPDCAGPWEYCWAATTKVFASPVTRNTELSIATLQTRKKKRPTKQYRSSKKSRRASTKHKRTRSYRRSSRLQTRARDKVKPIIHSVNILYDSLLVPGIIYRKLDVTLADSAHATVHTVTCVVRNPRYTIELVQARDQLGKLEPVPSIVRRLDSAQNREVLVALNASYWQAVTHYPIGVSVMNGEVVTAQSAPWNTLFLDRRYRPWIDSAALIMELRLPRGARVPIACVNKQTSADEVALFNRFSGDSIPIRQQLDSIARERLQPWFIADTLDPILSKDSLAEIMLERTQQWLTQYRRGKMLVRYLRPPAINQPIPCIVLAMQDSGVAEIPLRGAILSYPVNHMLRSEVRPGDTLTLFFRTHNHDSIQFHMAVSGTPLLIRDGTVKPELMDTTRQGSAFVEQRLARTAIGTDLIQSVLYFVAVEVKAGVSVGMSLRELAQFMKRFGAYNAINLDGGGSTTMVVGQRCVVPDESSYVRPVANALVVWRRRLPQR